MNSCKVQYNNCQLLTYLITPLILIIIISGCSVTKQSQFNRQSINLGASREAVIAKFGNPYKTGLHKDTNQVFYEDFYYKENLYIKKWYEVTTVLCFQNGILVSMEPGRETALYKNHYIRE